MPRGSKLAAAAAVAAAFAGAAVLPTAGSAHPSAVHHGGGFRYIRVGCQEAERDGCAEGVAVDCQARCWEAGGREG